MGGIIIKLLQIISTYLETSYSLVSLFFLAIIPSSHESVQYEGLSLKSDLNMLCHV